MSYGIPSKKIKISNETIPMSASGEDLDSKALNKFSRQNAALGSSPHFSVTDRLSGIYRSGNNSETYKNESSHSRITWNWHGDCQKSRPARGWSLNGTMNLHFHVVGSFLIPIVRCS